MNFGVQNVVDSKEYMECLVLHIYRCVKISVLSICCIFLSSRDIYISILLYRVYI